VLGYICIVHMWLVLSIETEGPLLTLHVRRFVRLQCAHINCDVDLCKVLCELVCGFPTHTFLAEVLASAFCGNLTVHWNTLAYTGILWHTLEYSGIA
jgi:hypothetical protein